MGPDFPVRSLFLAKRTRYLTLAMLVFALTLGAVASRGAAPARAADYVPGEVVVGYAPGPAASDVAHAARMMGVRATQASSPDPSEQIVRVPRGKSIWQVIARLRRQRGVAYAVPDYIAHAAGWIPNDPGTSHHP